MYVIKDNAVVLIETKKIVGFSDLQDDRIVKIERVIAAYFNTSVHELDVFSRDTDAKIYCCFLLHDMLSYSVGSLAMKYKINRFFLRNKLTEIYKKCLQNEADMRRVIALRAAFFCE